MPLTSTDGNTTILLHGELFNDSITSSRCSENPKMKCGDLMRLYEREGEDFFAQLNGWFCGLILNRREGTITIFTDRYGMGRLYVHEAEGEFIFATEAKSILKVRSRLREIKSEFLAEKLRYNCVLNNKTLFPGIELLPRGARWTFHGGAKPAKSTYFDIRSYEAQPVLEPEAFYRQWADTVATIFPRYAHEGASVAMSMTAGLDTRLIMAALRGKCAEHVSYTFGGAWGELFDIRTARKAANIYKQKHLVFPISEKFLDRFEHYATQAVYISDGMHDAFGAHDVYFNEIAREAAPVRLTGKFGSEVVRIRRLMPSNNYGQGILTPELQSQVERLPNFHARDASGHPVSKVVGEEIPWHEYGRVAVEQSKLTLRTPYMDNALVKLMYQAPPETRIAGDLQERYVRDRAPELAHLWTNLGRFSSSSPIVTKLMYYPLWALFKTEYIYLYATPHWLTRIDRTFDFLHLERLLAGRQKWEGYRIWGRTHFSTFLRDTLLNPQAFYTQYFNYKVMQRMVERHTTGTHNYMADINVALSLELTHQSLLKSNEAA